MDSFLALQGQIWTLLRILQMTSKHAQKRHIKKSEKNHTLGKVLSPKTAKITKNSCFLVLEGQIWTLFSQSFANHF